MLDLPFKKMASAQSCLIYIMICIEVLGLLAIILIGVWLGQYGDNNGFGLNTYKGLLNLHSLIMPMGAVFFPANGKRHVGCHRTWREIWKSNPFHPDAGIVLYRAFRRYAARKVKWAHFVFQLIAFLLVIVGFTFAIMARSKLIDDFKNQNQAPDNPKAENGDRKHFYSVHSWLGLMCFIIFVLQVSGSLLTQSFQIPNEGSLRNLKGGSHEQKEFENPHVSNCWQQGGQK